MRRKLLISSRTFATTLPRHPSCPFTLLRETFVMHFTPRERGRTFLLRISQTLTIDHREQFHSTRSQLLLRRRRHERLPIRWRHVAPRQRPRPPPEDLRHQILLRLSPSPNPAPPPNLRRSLVESQFLGVSLCQGSRSRRRSCTPWCS